MFWNTFAKLCVDAGKSPNTVAAECGVKSSGTVTGWKNGAILHPLPKIEKPLTLMVSGFSFCYAALRLFLPFSKLEVFPTFANAL